MPTGESQTRTTATSDASLRRAVEIIDEVRDLLVQLRLQIAHLQLRQEHPQEEDHT